MALAIERDVPHGLIALALSLTTMFLGPPEAFANPDTCDEAGEEFGHTCYLIHGSSCSSCVGQACGQYAQGSEDCYSLCYQLGSPYCS